MTANFKKNLCPGYIILRIQRLEGKKCGSKSVSSGSTLFANLTLFFSGTLTLKAPLTTAADDIHKYFFIFFSEKIDFDISCESSARQRIHMKHQALFSLKNKIKKKKKKKKKKMSSAAIFVRRFKG